MPTRKKATKKWDTREVRNLITEIIQFQDDSVQASLHSLTSQDTPEDRRITREQAQVIATALESAMKDSAFKVLASKKL